MNRKRDLYLIAEAYESVTKKQDVGDEWTNMGDWVKFLSQPNISNKPVSYRVATQTPGGMSYGGNVTFNQIINNTKNLLKSDPSGKQKTLIDTANQLQDYFVGLNDAGVIDDTTRDDLMDMVANLGNTEKFVNSFGEMPREPVGRALPGQGPAITQRQKEAEEFRAVGDEELQSKKYTSDDMRNMLARMKREQGLPEQGTGTPYEQEYIKNKLEYVRRFQQQPPKEWDLQRLKSYLEQNK